VTSGVASVTKSLSISVTLPLKLTTTVLADGTVNVAYLATLAATGGTGTYVAWDVASGTLPDGTYLSTKYVKGTPISAGATTFEIRVTDSAGRTATSTVSLAVYDVPTVTTDALPDATRSVAYSFQLSAVGAKQPYKWSRSSGSLPRGFSVSSAGLVYGTTTTAGTYTVTFKVVDISGKRYATKTFTLVVI
jgi:hypothetical protein